MIAICHACNMTALLGHRVSAWGDDSILPRMQHDCIVGSQGFWLGLCFHSRGRNVFVQFWKKTFVDLKLL